MLEKQPSALDALTGLSEERRVHETRGANVRRPAALELGLAVLDAGGASVGMWRLRQLVTDAVAREKLSAGARGRDPVAEQTAAAPALRGADSRG